MKLVYPICCGADVHKKHVTATIARTDKKNITTYVTETFTTLSDGLRCFGNWLKIQDCMHVCLESTGKYWIPVFNVLEKAGVHVVLTHPKYVRAIKGQKTDKKDSRWIADLFKFDLVRASIIPTQDFRAMRELARYRSKLVHMRTSEKNRFQNAHTLSNIGLGSVLTDSLGKTSSNITEYLLETEEIDEEFVKSLIHKSARKKTELILDAIRSSEISPDQRFKLKATMSHIEYLDALIAKTELELFKHMRPHMALVQFLAEQLPGVTELSAALIIAEIGVDMKTYESSKRLVAWAGLAPTNNESAGKKKSTRISRAGHFLKPILVQCALAAIRDKREPYFAIKYERIKRRRGHNRAIIAIARMMLTCIYHMIDTGEVFNPSDYEELHHCESLPDRQSVPLSDEDAIAFLVAQGYDVSSLTKKLT